jgi:hypothetical protein
VRLQLCRAKGFSLQALSLATNGLPAVNVARPSKWGNPYTAKNSGSVHPAIRYAAEVAPIYADIPGELRGKNLACWCKPDESCHADVLLELANSMPLSEAGR